MSNSSSTNVIDIGREQIAAVYAKALFGAAQAQGKLDAVEAELSAVVSDFLEPHPEFARLLAATLVAPEEQLAILDRVFGPRVSPLLLSFLKVLAQHGRLNCLSAASRKLRDLVHEALGLVDVTLSAPGAIDDSLRKEISDRLETILGRKPSISVVTDASLLGGLIVRVGDTVFDGSLARQLAQLRGKMIERTIEAIETRREAFVTK